MRLPGAELRGAAPASLRLRAGALKQNQVLVCYWTLADYFLVRHPNYFDILQPLQPKESLTASSRQILRNGIST